MPEFILSYMEVKIYLAFNVFNALPKMKYHSVLSPPHIRPEYIKLSINAIHLCIELKRQPECPSPKF